MSLWTFQPLNLRTVHYLKMSGSNYPLMQHHLPEEWNPQLLRCKKPHNSQLFFFLCITSLNNTVTGNSGFRWQSGLHVAVFHIRLWRLDLWSCRCGDKSCGFQWKIPTKLCMCMGCHIPHRICHKCG
jgi:hypothetical protein